MLNKEWIKRFKEYREWERIIAQLDQFLAKVYSEYGESSSPGYAFGMLEELHRLDEQLKARIAEKLVEEEKAFFNGLELQYPDEQVGG